MKILITGINGSAGSYLGEFLVNTTNHQIFGTVRNHNGLSNIQNIKDKVSIIYVDLMDFPSLLKTLDKYRPDVIFHIASMANVRNSFDSPCVVVNNNVNITLHILEAVRLLKDKDNYNPIIQLCSTSEVYGNPSKEFIPIDENCPLLPINPYASSKLMQDSLGYVYFLNFKLNVIRTRMFSYFNPRRPDLFATHFARQIIDVSNGKKETVEHGNLSSIRTIIDPMEAAECYWLITCNGKIGEVYNIGGIEPISVGGVLEALIKKSGKNIPTKQISGLMRPSDIDRQIPNIHKFQAATGWTPKKTLSQSINDFWIDVNNLYR